MTGGGLCPEQVTLMRLLSLIAKASIKFNPVGFTPFLRSPDLFKLPQVIMLDRSSESPDNVAVPDYRRTQ
jgi:hypothetical protein